jgi:tetratricopeptide (TPR) repeat protein
MRDIDNIKGASDSLRRGNVKTSLNFLFNVVLSHPEWNINDKYDELMNNYVIMVDYMKRGYKDDKRQKVYDKLQSDVNLFIQLIQHHRRMLISNDYSHVNTNKLDESISFEEVRRFLEDYVSEAALLSLEGDKAVREEKKKNLYSDHYVLMDRLFRRIWIHGVWNDDTVDGLISLILASTIDSNDAQLIVSAVMLAGLEFFDYNQLRVLSQVYERSMDIYVRERALVGWMFVCQNRTYDSEEIRETVHHLMNDEHTVRELFDLQKQIVFCKNAEKDHDIIQNEIMPDLMKNNNLRVTRFGIEEKEQDPIQDILHPDAEDHEMENLEKSMGRIVDMQKSGVDIYFGGFSMMKNFPFFRTMSNWFSPFYYEHPGIADVMNNEDTMSLVKVLLESGPFCDSDKYSFCLAMVNIMGNIPSSMKEMLKGRNDGLGFGEALEGEKSSPAYIRRSYLQSLYRFYKLYTAHSEMKNPFDFNPCLLDSMFWNDNLINYYNTMVIFFEKMHLGIYSDKLLQMYPEEFHDFNFYMIRGSITGHYEYYRRAVELKPTDEKALASYAESLEYMNMYEEGEQVYRTVNDLYPHDRYEAGLCCCLIEQGKYEEALNRLYKLDFEKPNYMKAKRALAWVLFCTGKLSQAENYYTRIFEQHKILAVDYLNAGHVAFAMGEIKKAIDRYSYYVKRYQETSKHASVILENAIRRDKKYLTMNGICDADIQLMTDIVDFEGK